MKLDTNILERVMSENLRKLPQDTSTYILGFKVFMSDRYKAPEVLTNVVREEDLGEICTWYEGGSIDDLVNSIKCDLDNLLIEWKVKTRKSPFKFELVAGVDCEYNEYLNFGVTFNDKPNEQELEENLVRLNKHQYFVDNKEDILTRYNAELKTQNSDVEAQIEALLKQIK